MIDRPAHGKSGPGHAAAQSGAFQELGNQIDNTTLAADSVNDQNIGVIELAGGAGLQIESQPVCIVCDFARQNFDGYFAAQPRVPRAIDFTHAARSQRGQDLIGAQFVAGGQGPGVESFYLLS